MSCDAAAGKFPSFLVSPLPDLNWASLGFRGACAHCILWTMELCCVDTNIVQGFSLRGALLGGEG